MERLSNLKKSRSTVRTNTTKRIFIVEENSAKLFKLSEVHPSDHLTLDIYLSIFFPFVS